MALIAPSPRPVRHAFVARHGAATDAVDGDAPVIARLHGDGSGGRMRGDAGYALLLTAMLIMPLLVAVAFATDLGSWYAQGTREQRAADAAALAGVVWLDDPLQPTKWDTVAREAATKNGYTNGTNGVTVTVTRVSSNQIRVVISKAADQYFSKLFLNGQTITRSAISEFNEPVPMGSPRNYLGTGSILTGTVGTPTEPERKWAAISGYCVDKQQGDRIAARYSNGASGQNTCSGTNNSEFKDTNYEFYIELPAARTQAVDVVIYSGNYNDGNAVTGESNAGGTSGTSTGLPTTFTLYRADSTILDDSDNPSMTSVSGCTSGVGTDTDGDKTFNAGALEDNYSINVTGVTDRPGMWNICRIPTSAPAGKYILRVRNQASATGGPSNNIGSNAFSIFAIPNNANSNSSPGGQAICDARTTTTCPKVYSKDYMSISVNSVGGTSADMYLAEIGQEHAGKKVRIELWDSAEGATKVEILRPTGASPYTWALQTFSWTSTDGNSGTSTTEISNGGSVLPYNNDLLTIEFDLANNYNPPAGNAWYKIRYSFAGSSVTDRTTWSVEILGDPVHLEE